MSDSWKYQLSYYKELIDKYKWDLKPMIQLLEYLNRTGICDKFYPSNSHESLLISTGIDYAERRHRPMVGVTYLPDTRRFCLNFIIHQPRQVTTEYYHDPFDMTLIYRIEQWLLTEE